MKKVVDSCESYHQRTALRCFITSISDVDTQTIRQCRTQQMVALAYRSIGKKRLSHPGNFCSFNASSQPPLMPSQFYVTSVANQKHSSARCIIPSGKQCKNHENVK